MVGVYSRRPCIRSACISVASDQVVNNAFVCIVALHRLFGDVLLERMRSFMKVVVIKPKKFWAKILKGIFKI